MQGLLLLPDTMTRSITAGSRIVWLSPAPYNASTHPSRFPPDWHPVKWFNLKRTGSAFSSWPHSWLDESPGILHAPGRIRKGKTVLGEVYGGVGLGKRSFWLLTKAQWEIQPIIYQQQHQHLYWTCRQTSSRPSRRGRSVVVCYSSAPEMKAAGEFWDGCWIES